MPLNLDMDVLRTLVTADRLGSFLRAASAVGRSQSAVSQQIRKIEEQLGLPLFRKAGRGLVPTPAGEAVLSYARRILALNDEAVESVRDHRLSGSLRFGMSADFARGWLPALLGAFARTHPDVAIEAVVDRNRLLLERLDRGEVDLVLALGHAQRPDAEPLARLPLHWIGPRGGLSFDPDEPVPLASAEAPCFFRKRMIDALEAEKRPFRLVFTTASLDGLWAAVAAGLGVTLRVSSGDLPDSVRPIEVGLPMPPDPFIDLCLYSRPGETPAVRRLREAVLDTANQHLPAGTDRP